MNKPTLTKALEAIQRGKATHEVNKAARAKDAERSMKEFHLSRKIEDLASECIPRLLEEAAAEGKDYLSFGYNEASRIDHPFIHFPWQLVCSTLFNMYHSEHIKVTSLTWTSSDPDWDESYSHSITLTFKS
jgi:hypothetical protein